MSTISHGDIYWYDFGVAIDERQPGLRPVLIIQTDFLNLKDENYLFEFLETI